jgi:Sulfatase
LFLNLHMATMALPDPVLYARWATETLLLNARKRGRRLPAPGPGQDFDSWLVQGLTQLQLAHAPFPSPDLYLKHVFDNRFYDASFESVFSYLEARGLTRNMVTVVTSDHGMSMREQGESLYLHCGARPHEDLIRVPLVVRYPAGSEDARLHGRYPEPVSLIDLFPTLVELGLGRGVFARDLPVRGQNLATRLRNRSFEPYLIAESALGPSSYRVAPKTMGYSKAVIAGRMKLIHVPELHRTPAGGAGWPITVRLDEGWPFTTPRPPLERLSKPLDLLYDLVEDPHERHDLAAERPEEVARLKTLVRSWSCRSLPWGPGAPIWQGEARATLRALGYIQ